ncbi:molybdenum cofactor guanylyltransferase [Curtobacterium sp. B18]|uniref:molybdenum cofactor guanylyltransferase n=1 Tax=Curtobacterium sp. B18 TaxID=95614 RepID=UPI00034BA26D|nr:NTP transferase domain-containing protein [Curtobacterium sp. B18]
MHQPYDAVLLAGGRAARLGGIDKTALRARGTTLLEHAVAAAASAVRVVVVGPRDADALPPRVVRAREDPPFAGPVAAIAAGLEAVSVHAPLTLVLACDLVHPGAATARLVEAATARLFEAASATATDGLRDGVVAVDDDGRRQPLLALYGTAALREAVESLRADAGTLAGTSMRRLLAPLDLVEVAVPSALCADVDDPDAAARLTDPA